MPRRKQPPTHKFHIKSKHFECISLLVSSFELSCLLRMVCLHCRAHCSALSVQKESRTPVLASHHLSIVQSAFKLHHQKGSEASHHIISLLCQKPLRCSFLSASISVILYKFHIVCFLCGQPTRRHIIMDDWTSTFSLLPGYVSCVRSARNVFIYRPRQNAQHFIGELEKPLSCCK